MYNLIIFPFDTTISGSYTTAFRVLMLQMEEWPPIWWVLANLFSMFSRMSDKGMSLSLEMDEFVASPPTVL